LSSLASDALRPFTAHTADWFVRRYGEPTDIQARAWPRIAAGEHVLVTAPTGSGKTLAAFLWALDRLLSGAWEPGATRVLYVSPLKALGNDIRRNLDEPLSELARTASHQVPIRAEIRTGDTSQDARRRMQRRPPEILITTPETLNILLTSTGGRRLLTGLRCVILDEIHAVATGKRGIHLITAVERLVRLNGELQRIALSATVRPLDRVAAWVGGSILHGDPAAPDFLPRPVTVIESTAPKRLELEVALPSGEPDSDRREPDAFWAAFGRELRSVIGRNRSTLVFGNARRTVEKIARFVNEAGPDQVAYSHHGALSREIRTVVEDRLKAGELEAIVATSSLELGIDVGAVDQVVMVQTPPTVASTLQRLGRSGHGVGETSRGRLMPLLGRDLLEAAVVAGCAVAGDIEELRPTVGALDVLAQVLLSMTVAESWRVDELYAAVRAADPYRHLPRRHFDLVLEMLAGRYATTRLRSLRPLVAIDRIDGVVRARPGADRLLYLSGGTIPDRGTYALKIEGSGARLGELDEEFVWERSIGDVFTLGVQTWRVERITHNDVWVSPANARSAMAPFWRADERDRSSFISERMANLLEELEPQLDDEGFRHEVEARHCLTPAAAASLRRHLLEQRQATGCLPNRHLILVEHTSPPAGRGSHRQIVLHTMWGGRVNRPFATALSIAWQERWGTRPEVVHSADCVVVVYPAAVECDDPFALVPTSRLDELIERGTDGTGFFGARFREAAACALQLPRGLPGRRVPLWVHRQRAKELLEAVSAHDDFPLVLEAWRSCLQDEFELDVLRARLDEIADRRVTVRHVRTETPSPFTAQAAWKQTNELMYEDDVPTVRAGTRADLVREMALASHLRPRIDPVLAADLGARLQRLAPGWAPRDADDLLEWVKERLLIPSHEWRLLLESVHRDHALDLREITAALGSRLVMIRSDPGGGSDLVCAVENLPRIERALGRDIGNDGLGPIDDGGTLEPAIAARDRLVPSELEDDGLASLLGEWLRFYPPIDPDVVARALGIGLSALDSALTELAESQTVVIDELTEGATSPEVCDRVNLERLLRMARVGARQSLEPEPPEALPLLLAEHQGLGLADAVPEDLQATLEQLFGLALPAELWEGEVLPARLEPYVPQWLDALLTESDLRWVGSSPRRLLFALDDERGLFPAGAPSDSTPDDAIDELFPHTAGRFQLVDLARASGLGTGEIANRLWAAAWRGEVSCDSFAPVRQAVGAGFAPATAIEDRPPPRRGRRGGFDRWRRERPLSGAWFALAPAAEADDPLAADEERRERARIVLDRYGVVFRSLLERELPDLRWSSLFRAFRLLELGGEVVAGHFIDGIDGLQFASHPVVRRLRDGLDEGRVWWINAVDPGSPCGLGLALDDWPLPRRVAGNHMTFHGRNLILVSVRRGAELTIRVPPDHPQLSDYLAPLDHLLTRETKPLTRIDVETINAAPAVSSPYRAALAERFQVTRQPACLRLARKY